MVRGVLRGSQNTLELLGKLVSSVSHFMSGKPGVFVLTILKVIGANFLAIVIIQLERSVAFIFA